MRINSRVFTERIDLLDGIQIPNCPKVLKSVAERLIMMATKPGYSVPEYHTVSQLDKLLTLHYWQEYDSLIEALTKNDFTNWFLSSATSPDIITRARRWLVERNYIILKPSVQEYAIEAADKWRQSVRH